MDRPLNRLEYTLGPGLDLEYETEPQTSAPEPAMYETAYVTSHKDKCRAAAFSMDGSLVATGSVDASIKVLLYYCVIHLLTYRHLLVIYQTHNDQSMGRSEIPYMPQIGAMGS